MNGTDLWTLAVIVGLALVTVGILFGVRAAAANAPEKIANNDHSTLTWGTFGFQSTPLGAQSGPRGRAAAYCVRRRKPMRRARLGRCRPGPRSGSNPE